LKPIHLLSIDANVLQFTRAERQISEKVTARRHRFSQWSDRTLIIELHGQAN
jgi:hypothetical protein